MLATVLLTFASFLWNASASPVYNMQPAYITANIGTTGRNIRNLPCISRKTNQSGVCMFAIDCLKANGTHLGTCIDRFYFGSCCHIEPVHDIIDNTIDTSIFPGREPPNRINSTQKIPTTTSTTTTTTKTTITTTTTTRKPEAESKTTKRPPIILTKEPGTTEVPYKLTTFQSIDGNEIQTTTLKPPTTTRTKPSSTKPPSLTRPTTVSTGKPSITQARPRPKPSLTVKPVKVTKYPSKTPVTSKPAKPTTKPIKTTTKTTTRKPTNKTTTQTISEAVKITPKPTTTKPTNKTTTQTIPEAVKTTPKPTTAVLNNVSTISLMETISRKTTKIPEAQNTTTKIPVTATTYKSTTTISTTPKLPETPMDATTKSSSALPTSTESNLIFTNETVEETKNDTLHSNDIPVNNLNMSVILGTVNGNVATNEIESAKPPLAVTLATTSTTTTTTSKLGLVTWTLPDESNTTGSFSNATEDWIPITTPDGWVLLPSVTTSTESSITVLTTLPPTLNTTQETSQPIVDNTMENATVSAVETSTITSNITGNVTEIMDTSTSLSETSTELLLQEDAANMSDYTDVCGRRMYPEGRIVGGEKSSYGKWPWQISLRQWRTSTYLHKCGAALLNENWAITAAHCVDNVPPSDLLLRLGEHDLSTDLEPYLHQERRVQIVASHPQFDPRTFEYDLALLRFYEPVKFQPNIIPVCVPQTDENFVGRTAYVTGWGRLYEDGPLPSILQEVSVPVINNTLCESMYRMAGYIEHIPHIFICAGWRRGGFDSCEGDSGGPMVIQREDKRFLLAGVISWGIGCAEPNQPGVYTRISEFRDWINQILQF